MYKFIIIFQQENKRDGVKRNYRMKKAKGEYLFFLDRDYFKKKWLKFLFISAEKSKADIIIHFKRNISYIF